MTCWSHCPTMTSVSAASKIVGNVGCEMGPKLYIVLSRSNWLLYGSCEIAWTRISKWSFLKYNCFVYGLRPNAVACGPTAFVVKDTFFILGVPLNVMGWWRFEMVLLEGQLPLIMKRVRMRRVAFQHDRYAWSLMLVVARLNMIHLFFFIYSIEHIKTSTAR